jgi:hypothetical protein
VSGSRPEPTEAAQVLAAIVPALPGDAVRDLQLLLAHRLAFISPSLARELRLGLLLDLVAVSDGELPSTDDYEHERAGRARRGQAWPAASTLARGFNGWSRACAAAMRLHHLGSPARMPRDFAHGGASAPYSRAQVLGAIRRFHARERAWPT